MAHRFSPAAKSYLDAHAVDLDLAWDLGVRSDRDDLVYPYETPKGELFKRRREAGGVTKQPKGEPLILWFPDGRPEPGADVLLCEGEGDALAALSALDGLALAVAALPGVSTPVERVTAELASANSVILALDGDDAGRKAADRLARALQPFVELRIIKLGDGEDLASTLYAETDRPAWLRAAVEGVETVPKLRPLKEETGAYAKPADRKRELLAKGIDPDHIDVGELLRDVEAFIHRYVFLSDAQGAMVALWVLHTHSFAEARCTPYLSITSAEPGSGKTLLLEVLRMLVPRPWLTGRTSAAVLPRKIEGVGPVLLLDESDTAFKGDKDYANALRGILDSGYKRSGVSTLCVGQGANIDFKDFKTFCAKAIAGLAQLPDTVAARSFPIRLEKIADEQVIELDEEEAEVSASELYDRLDAFSLAAAPRLRGLKPERPEGLDPRTKEISKPVLAIADVAGGSWPARARWALLELVGDRRDTEESSIGVQLLSDIHDVFEKSKTDRLATKELINALVNLDERPWAEWRRGLPITSRSLSGLLKPYRVKSRTIRLGDGTTGTAKGFSRDQFTDTFRRYLPQDPPPKTTQRHNGSVEPKTSDSYATQEVSVSDRKGPQTSLESQCVGVSDRTPVKRENNDSELVEPTPAICRYASHREHDRLSPDGKRLICGACHPLVTLKR